MVEASDVYYQLHFIKFTISIGISRLLPSDRDIDMALSRADHALYIVKNRQRNGVHVYQESPLSSGT